MQFVVFKAIIFFVEIKVGCYNAFQNRKANNWCFFVI